MGIVESNGFRQVWWVYSRYEIQEDLVVPIDTGSAEIEARAGESFKSSGLGALRAYRRPGTRSYLPITCPELPAEFAKLASGAEREVLAFVHRYGQLGYYFAAESGLARHSPELRELRNSKYTKGDPVSWIIAHAKAVQLVLQLREAFDDPVRLQQHLEGLTSEEDGVQDGNRQPLLDIAFVDRGRLYTTHSRLYTVSDA